MYNLVGHELADVIVQCDGFARNLKGMRERKKTSCMNTTRKQWRRQQRVSSMWAQRWMASNVKWKA